ncbi:MAG: phage tail tape measure protein [Ruminococcaceae bacterium]|nr:phage tail tape measure protein [Oscillospiraceae bacterium]
MASRQYEMLFTLGAKLNTAFAGSFSSAQKILQATQKELAAMNKVQSDITGYQKMIQSLEKSENQLALYQKQLEIVRTKIKENGDSTGELAIKETELVDKIDRAKLAIADKTARLNTMRQGLEDAGVDVNNLAREAFDLQGEMAKLARQEEEAAKELDNFGVKGIEAFDAMNDALESSGIIDGLQELFNAYKECVSISMEFEATMSTVEALSGATAQEMKALTAQAKEMGATTVFTGNQSAEAMTYMGMAGWDAAEMISGLPGVIALAAASGEDLASVSDIVTDNLTAFGLAASDTAHFADVLAAAATNSNTDVGIMGETFKSSAAVAGALGYSVEDVAVAVGLMANAGVKGSIAGTALKNTFNGLLSGATLTAEAFGEVEYTTVNSDGTMKNFSATINELRGYFDQMTEAERVNNAMALAGQRGYNGLLAILNATDEDYQSLSASINNCTGAAQRMADIKLDNLQGDVTLFNSALEGVQNTLGGMYNEEMRGLTQLGTEILTGINEFCEQNPAVVKGIMAVVAGIGAIVAIYAAYKAAKVALAAAEKILAASMTATNAQMLIFAGVAVGVIAALAVIRELCKEAAFEEQTLTTATQEQQNAVTDLTAQYEDACAMYGETSDQARALKYDLDEATAAVESQSFSVSELYAEIDALHDSTAELLTNMNASTTEIDDNYESAMILSAKLRELSTNTDKSAASTAEMEPIIRRLNEMYPELGLSVENVADRMGSLNDEIERAAGAQSLQAKYDAANESLDDLYIKQKQLQEVYEKAEVAQAKARDNYLRTVGDGNVGKALWATINGTEKAANEALDDTNEAFSTAAEDLRNINRQIAEAEAAIEEYGAVVSGTSEETVSAYDAISIAVNGVTKETEELIQAYNDAYQAALESVSGQYNLWDEAAEESAVSIGKINSNLEGQADYWSKYNANLETLLGKTGEIEGLREVIATFADGSPDSVNMIAGMANATDDEIREMIDNWEMLKDEQGKVVKSLADTKVDFEDQMNQISDTVADTIEGMNMSAEARQAANDTIQAYADAIRAGQGSAVEAAAQVKAAMAAALGFASEAEKTGSGGGFRPSSVTGSGGGFRPSRGYAVGTDYAAPGLALVGENGPELVNFRGGEAVYTAKETSGMLGNKINISPNFVINGGSGDFTEQNLREIADQLVDMVKDALAEAGIDKQRSVYA